MLSSESTRTITRLAPVASTMASPHEVPGMMSRGGDRTPDAVPFEAGYDGVG